MSQILDLYRRALDTFGHGVHAVAEEQWHDPTPCRDWDVRELVTHLVREQLWAPPLLSGRGAEQLDPKLAGDVLGQDARGAWDRAAEGAAAAFAADGALARTVQLSYGQRPAEDYLWEMTTDLTVHAWDLARGIGIRPARSGAGDRGVGPRRTDGRPARWQRAVRPAGPRRRARQAPGPAGRPVWPTTLTGDRWPPLGREPA